MEKEKIEYMIQQRDLEKTTTLDLDISDNMYEKLKGEAKSKGVPVEDFLYSIVVEKMIDKEKSIVRTESFDEVIDIYDMYKLEELLETDKEYLLINPSGKHLVMIPNHRYEELKNIINENGGKYDRNDV